MYYDYHMHCDFSADSKTPMIDMIEKSIDLGLKEICFTDHVDYDIIGNPNVKVDYIKYFNDLNYYKNKYRDRISIKKGIEMGLQNHILDKCSKDINSHDFDFVIASIHSIDRLELFTGDFHKGKSQREAYEKYYERLLAIITKYKDYSVLGHLDLIKRYGNFDTVLDDYMFKDILEQILKTAIYDGKGIEVNTSCFRYKLPDLTPSTSILNMYKELGGEILTVGSDSHNISQVGHKLDVAYEVIKDIGFKYICKFDKMKPEFIKI